MPVLPATRIDTHHHVVPGFYRDWLVSHGVESGGMPMPSWSVEGSREVMRSLGVRTALLSVSTPGVDPWPAADAAAVARDLNDFTTQIVRTHAATFGHLATIPLPDVDASVNEAVRALDELGADGVVLLGNARGTYLGDASYEPLMRVLDEHDAVVLIHPSELPGGAAPGIPAYAADFLLDTTRAAVSLCRSGVLDRYPRIRWILSHGGGIIPYAAPRVAQSASVNDKPLEGLRLLRRFYYDTALTPFVTSMPALLRFAKPGHVVFGSDYPFAAPWIGRSFAAMLRAYPKLSGRAINHSAAERLFPRLER